MSTSTSSLQFDSADPAAASWKGEVSAKLVAHRTRRARTPDSQTALPGFDTCSESRPGRKSVAERVAERYAKAPSYCEVMAAHAAAARAAEAAAEAAAQAHAVTQAVLAGLEIRQQQETTVVREAEPEAIVASPQMIETETEAPAIKSALPMIAEVVDPLEDVTFTPPQPLPAKLIEFPRELVATRKARPRLAEGPLRDAEAPPEGTQLRIFEVEPEAISKEPAVETVLPEWHSIRLDATPVQGALSQEACNEETYRPLFELPLRTAHMGDRLMAAIVDASLVVAAFFVFVLVFVACTAHPPAGKTALAGAGMALFGLAVLYQWLFFTYSDATPGMRYARIALCTFDDENPTRTAMRKRVGALLLSALPLGLGYLWAFFDEDHLGWHDRITRTYQRSYR